MEGEIQDWEILQSSRSTTEDDNSRNLEEIEDVTRGMIRFDHFSLENQSGLSRVEANDEDGSVQSGSPGWIEPSSDVPYGPKHFSELWSDSSSDRLEEQRLVDDDVNNEVGIVEYSESIVQDMDLMSSDERKDESLLHPVEGEGDSVSVDPCVKSGGGGGGGEEKGFVWWKIPIEVLKYCVLKINPIWSLSMAAAFVGFVMLGRRLYNMKKKSRTLQLKVLLDDKKVANHAARWNEAISVVKRVPLIRPALPSSVGMMNQWSMMSLR
ncbi:unnamed protein product [Arabidopsis lyrata]|uniref:uncharacterized protein LOC9304429 isoform X1 n=1 Tax=Arabidopsis lyrata subsp. lyrata TaxID=81972 RepID=UPI000A29C655|nr:uncharacterized protein LOC9304429 isoform X1 [Arabidopsis lyrata subsp. lyrata]CAH8276836.1 unnamed protein product [Arabidopsis lyrata]|eukprot:XP_020872702.1 uncharacterized protein LOC9304429 isoform X1 [Arabidopsis lyrata subsp. lyrata]